MLTGGWADTGEAASRNSNAQKRIFTGALPLAVQEACVSAAVIGTGPGRGTDRSNH